MKKGGHQKTKIKHRQASTLKRTGGKPIKTEQMNFQLCKQHRGVANKIKRANAAVESRGLHNAVLAWRADVRWQLLAVTAPCARCLHLYAAGRERSCCSREGQSRLGSLRVVSTVGAACEDQIQDPPRPTAGGDVN